ncbi:alpha/beta hydrolase fold protein [Lojkania enalia]|uniref:Alpha/beta hydrolase fold protein n=1 Tax=Lojkania enalia TaxID=147567 RepID=A0A9P4JZ69_9PLEO|nr:alpha/beta hydrolase fold protein [Didymosphaeria enalia]
MSWISDLGAYFLSSNTKNPLIRAPAASTNKPPKCKYRLDNDSSNTVALPDGRILGYAQYGSQTGQPILYLHGLPGSRVEAASLHDIGLELGVRIIATDRPGYGWSSPHPGRTLLDFPKDLEHLAKHLELDTYSVLGVSGGGPYALASAAALPREKLKCVSIVCGIGPTDIGMSGANWVNWIGFTFGWRYSFVAAIRWFFRLEPAARLELTDEERFELHMQRMSRLTNEKDLEVLNDADFAQLFLRTARESYRQGFDAVTDDGRLICLDYGFRIEDIRSDLPVHLWYGKQDAHVPLNHGQQIAARLGDRAQLRVEDDTHASIWLKWKEEVLKDMIKST